VHTEGLKRVVIAHALSRLQTVRGNRLDLAESAVE
jgi:hypothetical protein